MKRKATYPAPGLCIFCAKERGTTDEHVVPRGIGGSLIIRDGTCRTCLETIAPFESALMNNDFEPARVFLGIKSTTNRLRDKMHSYFPKDPDARTLSKKYGPATDHSGLIAFINYRPPGLEDGRAFDAPFPGDFGITIKCFIESSNAGPTIMGSSWDDLKFPRLLAKIAHSYWVAENGAGSIWHVLPKYILGHEIKGIGFFVGGYEKTPVPGEDLHFLNCGVSVINSLQWGFVDIGLFASYGPQTNYRVYVGLCR